MISETYVDVRLTLDDEKEGRPFGLVVERFDAGPFQLDEMEIGARASFGFEPEDVFFVTRVTLRLRLPDGAEDFDPGEVALLRQPDVAATSEVRDFGQLVTTLRAPTIR